MRTRWVTCALAMALLVQLVGVLPTRSQANEPDLNAGPFAFHIMGALYAPEFGQPLDWGPNEDGRYFLLVSLEAQNVSGEAERIDSDYFRINNHGEYIKSDDDLAKRAGELGLATMGDQLGDTLDSGERKVYLVAWRLSPEIQPLIMHVNYGDGDEIELTQWLDQQIAAVDLVPTPTVTSTATQTATVTVTPTVTNTIPATETPVPMATAESTSTREPTRPPVDRSGESSRATGTTEPTTPPTATVVQDDNGQTEAEEAYLADIETWRSALEMSSSEFTVLFSLAGDNPSLIFDPVWNEDFQSAMDTWHDAYDAALLMEPSDRQEDIHDNWLEMTRLMDLAATQYELGVANVDSAALEEGTIYVNQATTYALAVTDAIRDFVALAESEGVPTEQGREREAPNRDEPDPRSPVDDCSPFTGFDDAQAYYEAHTDEWPIIDPDMDGFACENYFGVDTTPLMPSVDPGEIGTDGGVPEPTPDQSQVDAPPTQAAQETGGSCDPSYPSLCLPIGSPDLDCGEVGARGFPVLPPDPHGFDRDQDGVGCES